MENLLVELIEKNRKFIKDGQQAQYIPALKKADPNDIAICLIDKEGSIYRAGKYKKKFTLQSISKLISLIQAIEDRGIDFVFKRVGYQATDEKFNSLIKLDLPTSIKPANPMINSGAIVTTSLIEGEAEESFMKILDLTRRMAKNPTINYNREVYLSEKDTGDRNRAIAYLMKSKDMIKGDVEEILDRYFKQCSIEVDTVDLANIALTIANKFKDIDLKKTDKKELATIVVSIMAGCGMYDSSGIYMSQVAIPSKSGVSGGLMGVLPSRMGIALYNPVLDEYGNSIVAYKIIKDLSEKLDLKIW